MLCKSQPTQFLYFSFQGEYLKYLTTEWHRPWCWCRAKKRLAVSGIFPLFAELWESPGVPREGLWLEGDCSEGWVRWLFINWYRRFLKYFKNWYGHTCTHSSVCKTRVGYEVLPATTRRENKSYIQKTAPKSCTPMILRRCLAVISISVLPGKLSRSCHYVEYLPSKTVVVKL